MSGRVSISFDELILLQAKARGFSFLPRQPVHSLLSGRHASRLRGRGLAFEELRHYRQGDDVRTIDWKATARLRSPHVRVYNEERERPVLLLVDQRSPMFFGSRRAMKSVAAAEVAALAAWRTVSGGDRVGGIVFSDDEMIDLRPNRSQNAVLRLLHEVVRLNQALASSPAAASSVNVSLNRVLEATHRRATHDYLVVLISDLDGADDTTQRLATEIAAHNDMIVVGIYDPLGAALKPGPGMVAATGRERLALPEDAALGPAFTRTFADRVERWMEIFRALRVPVIPISAAESTIDQLRELFGRKLAAQ